MSDTENVTEVEVETPTTTAAEDNLRNFVDAIQASNFNNAKDLFDDMLNSKMSDAMEAEKVAVANTVFNGGEPTEDELELELDFDDEVEVEDEDEVEDDTTDDTMPDHDEVEYEDAEVVETEDETEVEES